MLDDPPRLLSYAASPARERRPIERRDVVSASKVVLLLFALPVAAVLVAVGAVLSSFKLALAAVVLLVGLMLVLVGGLVWTRSIRPQETGATLPADPVASSLGPDTPAVLPYATPVPDPPPRWPAVVDRLLVSGIGGILFTLGGLGMLWWAFGTRNSHSIVPQSPVLPVGLMLAGLFPLWLGLRRR